MNKEVSEFLAKDIKNNRSNEYHDLDIVLNYEKRNSPGYVIKKYHWIDKTANIRKVTYLNKDTYVTSLLMDKNIDTRVKYIYCDINENIIASTYDDYIKQQQNIVSASNLNVTYESIPQMPSIEEYNKYKNLINEKLIISLFIICILCTILLHGGWVTWVISVIYVFWGIKKQSKILAAYEWHKKYHFIYKNQKEN